jgi:beta-mannanase
VIVALAGAALTLGAVQAGFLGTARAASHRATYGSAGAHRWPIPLPKQARVSLGVTTLPLARNSWRAWRASDLASVNEFENGIHKRVRIVMWYADWVHGQPLRQQLEAVARRDSIPEITWEPWNSLRAVKEQPRFRLRNIIAGRFDPYIRSWADTMAHYRKPVRLRFAQEMNGNWYPWSEHANGNHTHEFARAWRHIHDIFTAAGATNVQWVWSPAAVTMPRAQYPGDAYVDMVSLSLFNGGSQLRYTRWRSFSSLAGRSLAKLQVIAPHKPIEISEIGCAPRGGNKAAWIRDMFASLRRYPAVRSVVWYDLFKWSDWKIRPSSPAAAAYAAAVASSRFS